jgi:DNA-binding NarL/FixJ family response regulator
MSRPIRVALVDDDPLVRAGLSMILGGSSQIELVGEAADGDEVPALVREVAPDVVLMDIRMPRVNGLDATERLLAQTDPPKVIVLTTFDADEYVLRALGSGASGFLLKDTAPADIVDAIGKVTRGDPMLSPSVTAQLIKQVAGTPPDERSARAEILFSELSDREREVALAVGHGKSNAEIGADLFMSVATVKAHVSRVLMKLEATNRVQIAIVVHDAGLA